MRKLYLLLPIILLIGISCEEILETLSEEEETTIEEEDTIPPSVFISSHISGQTVDQIVTITATAEDNEGISEVAFYINDLLVVTDSVPPYEYDWDTQQYENNSEHTVKVISYDSSYNSTESETIILIVYRDSSNFVELWGELYSIEHTDTLDLRGNSLSSAIPPEIGKLINLEYLDLGSNNLTGTIPSEIWNLTKLTYLNLSKFNFLTGTLPSEIGNLTDLRTLHLRDNSLSGAIPPEIGNLINLINLNLGFNDFTGSIPSTIGNLSNLTNIYLDDNNLSGIVPDEICNLGGIEFNTGWIHNNKLCPPYPPCIEYTMGDQDTSNCN